MGIAALHYYYESSYGFCDQGKIRDELSNSFAVTFMALGIEVEWFNCLYKCNFFNSGMLCTATSRYVGMTCLITDNVKMWLGSNIFHA